MNACHFDVWRTMQTTCCKVEALHVSECVRFDFYRVRWTDYGILHVLTWICVCNFRIKCQLIIIVSGFTRRRKWTWKWKRFAFSLNGFLILLRLSRFKVIQPEFLNVFFPRFAVLVKRRFNYFLFIYIAALHSTQALWKVGFSHLIIYTRSTRLYFLYGFVPYWKLYIQLVTKADLVNSMLTKF